MAAAFCLCTTLPLAFSAALHAQEVARKAPPTNSEATNAPQSDAAPAIAGENNLPDDPGASRYPLLEPLAGQHTAHIVTTARHQSYARGHLIFDGDVKVTYGDYTVYADHVEYDQATHIVEATGNLSVTGGKASESLMASRGTVNMRDQTGTFYDVHGSVGLRSSSKGKIYTVGNPFLFSGRMLVKHGPADYDIYDGSVTSCQLPHPDWSLTSAHFTVRNGKAEAHGTAFRLRNIPILYLPFVSHPVPEQGADQRSSGFMIPVVGQSSTKGFILGEQIYLALSRSTDLTVGAEYFSRRGWQQSATFRYKGRGLEFLQAHFSDLVDRGFQGTILRQGPNGSITSTTGYVNQGGEDIAVSGRKDFAAQGVRTAANIEYLSSYAYRQAFTDTFNQAVATDIKSYAFATFARNGYVASLEGDRYQGLKRTITGEQVRIVHVPQLDVEAMEHSIGRSPLLWSGSLQSSAIKRTQGTDSSATQFNTGVVERFEFRPVLSLPLHFDGFALRGTAAIRESWYSHSRTAAGLPGPLPVERDVALGRSLFEGEVEFRTPVLERTFEGGPFRRVLGRAVRHTIEPEVRYRYVTGVSDFNRTLRFDARDVVSNTNELEYGLTQRLFLRPTRLRPCEVGELAMEEPAATGSARPAPPLGATHSSSTATGADGNATQPDMALPTSASQETGSTSPEARTGNETDAAPVKTGDGADPGIDTAAAATNDPEPVCGGTRESLRWRIVQRRYFNTTFGTNVLVAGATPRPTAANPNPTPAVVRNVLETTMDLSGVAFLTGQPRDISPIVSEMRLSATRHLDVEWDMNYDTVLNKFTQSNTFLNYHAGDYFGGVSYARLNAPGRFQRLDTSTTNTTSALSDFSQLRVLLGYGTPVKTGLSVAANVGLDLTIPQPQYGALQVSYNWNCCGISAEYRKFELGSVRNENAYRFNFTLANIGSAGNLRRAERLF